eukprot:CAMPEP_0119397808 /NCGR_PEP_ID=MMETSP1334-20130426/140523_1 /TAXON_ID=127549 /ORGANISM="Calcidiscus leptoporus, Strain RCC1130" /LENGTH=79 /DNA_ID=CAMNT_0007421655 /DNA_START=1191 /DNA_END=1430 /DNA_ORIENTATION=-
MTWPWHGPDKPGREQVLAPVPIVQAAHRYQSYKRRTGTNRTSGAVHWDGQKDDHDMSSSATHGWLTGLGWLARVVRPLT